MKKHLLPLLFALSAAATEPEVGPPFTPYHPPSVPDTGSTVALSLVSAAALIAMSKLQKPHER